MLLSSGAVDWRQPQTADFSLRREFAAPAGGSVDPLVVWNTSLTITAVWSSSRQTSTVKAYEHRTRTAFLQ
jgi:hypothetical protein